MSTSQSIPRQHVFLGRAISRLPLLFVVALLPLVAAEPSAPPFQDGDRVCFIGDSITHGGLYTGNITLFYATRFPARKITWFNRGITGDTAAGALRRFDWDIIPSKPTVSAIMLGMNDVNRGLYGITKQDQKILDRERQALDDYAKNLAGLADQLVAAKSALIVITPSIFDQTCSVGVANTPGVNDALATCAATGRAIAAQHQAGLVDIHGPMTAINASRQTSNPAFTIVGADRVHPGGPGSLVMAYLFLRAQGNTPTVATMAIDATTGAISAQDNCVISALTAQPGEVAFTVLEHALPFPTYPFQGLDLGLVPFTQDLNQEVLRVTGLATGSWQIVIDGRAVATCTATELERGVNLAVNVNTPQYIQALVVSNDNIKRQALISQKLRTIAAVQHIWLSRAGVANSDYPAAQKVLEPLIAAEKSDYFRSLMKTYVEQKPNEAALLAEVTALDAKMQSDSQPKPHRYVIKAAP